ncbi:putative conserved lipoprotein LpqG [Streptosporangium carneum]|uniref:Conserved lipoprotein LpqG n=1 Tax=Streptosporangium carneum TaxID=47481 RepID=A0A9W6MDH1_9ACTN|nr:putative conserved lipoprotein LpqG [Streptosporangium carneum]
MSHTVAAAAFVTMGMFGGAAFADSGSDVARVVVDESQAQVTVTGEGSLSSPPDIMRLNTGVEVRRATPGQAFADARRAAARLTKALLKAGIDAKDLRTNELALGPEYDTYPKVSGYRAVQGVEAVVRDVENADKVIEAAVEAGEEVRLNGVSFEISDGRKVLRAAREVAFKDARSRAEQYAKLAGRELGPVVTIAEENVTPPRPMAYGAGIAADKASISPGQQSVSVSVRVVYGLR